MAGQGRSTDSFKRDLHFDGSLDVMNGNELPQQRVSTSALDYNGGSFTSMLLEPSPPQSPTQVSTTAHMGNTSSHYSSNPEFEQNQASQGLINIHGSLQIEPCSSSQVHPHLTRTQNEPFCSCQSAAINYMDYEYNNNNNINHYGLGPGSYSSSFHRNMTVGNSAISYRQAPENLASNSGEGKFGRTGRTSQATSVERTTSSVMCSGFCREHNAATPLLSFFTMMSYRDEQLFQVPPVNNVTERHSFPWTNNLTAKPQQYAQQPSLLDQHLQNLRNFALNLRDDIDQTIQTQAALEPIRCPLLADDDEEIETDEDEDEDMDTDEDSNAGNTDLQDDDNPDGNGDDDNDNGNEAEDQIRDKEAGVMQETTGNANVNAWPVVDNTMAMQEEEEEEEEGDGGDGLEVADILAGLSMESYRPQAHLETEPPCCSICLGSFQEGERLGILDCEHRFHYICIGEWLTTKNSCPLCRKVGLAI